MQQLADRLRAALGGAYAITRELGGGGMSRVFLAEDRALGRSVVIKVLHEELAASVNAERFKREVQLSARLQHPHIVPVLAAGEVDGLPYYVMPFVKGESLRTRLASGPLPINESVSILSDVATALAYAHGDGVVHRDIKPDNILLSAGAATVADFGIAKALSSARQGENGATLTTFGTSLGTPAYMAPEQVAGDPGVDQRADLYSFGCVAYEMLTGAPPFAGRSPQQLLAAQVMEPPVPVAVARPDTPPMLAALVMRCLEKDPAARPASAAEIAMQLSSSGVHETAGITPNDRVVAAGRDRRKRRGVLGAFLLAALAVGAIGGYRALHPVAAPDRSLSLAVAPFEVLDPQLALWKEGLVDVLSRNLDGAGPLRAISPSVAIKQWEGRSDRASALAFARRLPAKLVLYGQLMPAGRDLVDAKVWIVDASRADLPPAEVQYRDSSARMDRVSDSLSVRILGAIARGHDLGAARLASLGSGSLPAIKAFLQGAQYFRRTAWDSAAAAFRQAVAADSTFGIAYALLGQSIGWTAGANDAESQRFTARAGALVRPGLAPRDSLMLTALRHYAAANGSRGAHAQEMRLAIAAAEAATARYANDAELWYLLGDMRYHGDVALTDREALALFDRSIQADSDFAPAYIHAIELAYAHGRAAGDRYAAAYLSRNPRDVEADGMRLAALLADPARAREAAAVLDTVSIDVMRKAYPALAWLPDSAAAAITLARAGIRRAPEGRMKDYMQTLLAGQLAMRGRIAEAWPIAVQRRSYDAAAIAALGLVPPDSARRVLVPWMAERSDASIMAYPFLAAMHDTATLAAAETGIARFAKTDTVAERKPIFAYVLASLRGYMALAAGDSAKATREFEALPDSIISLRYDELVRARLIAKSDPRRAIALLERRASPAGLMTPVRMLERARIAERVGDRERATEGYAYVAEVWAQADPGPLRDALKEARDALQRLAPGDRAPADRGPR